MDVILLIQFFAYTSNPKTFEHSFGESGPSGLLHPKSSHLPLPTILEENEDDFDVDNEREPLLTKRRRRISTVDSWDVAEESFMPKFTAPKQHTERASVGAQIQSQLEFKAEESPALKPNESILTLQFEKMKQDGTDLAPLPDAIVQEPEPIESPTTDTRRPSSSARSTRSNSVRTPGASSGGSFWSYLSSIVFVPAANGLPLMAASHHTWKKHVVGHYLGYCSAALYSTSLNYFFELTLQSQVGYRKSSRISNVKAVKA